MSRRKNPMLTVPFELPPHADAAGGVSWYPNGRLPELVAALPEGARLYARPHLEGVVSRIVWPMGGRDRWQLLPDDTWDDVDPAEAMRQVEAIECHGCLSPSQLGRRLVNRVFDRKQMRKWWSLEPEIVAHLDPAVKGGLQRTWRTAADAVTLVDLRKAYASAMLGPLPAGRPAHRRCRLAEIPEGAMCIVRADVRTAPDRGHRLVLHGRRYPEHLRSWMGPLPELLDLIDLRYLEPPDDEVDAWVFGRDHVLAYILDTLRPELDPRVFRTLYTRLWVVPYARGGWVGEVTDHPAEFVAGRENGQLWRRIPGWPRRILWLREPPSLWSWQLPQIPAWVAGIIRARMARLAAAASGLAAIYVDSLVAEDLPEHMITGDLRVQARGSWRAAAPGRYVLGERVRWAGSPSVPAYHEMRDAAWHAVSSAEATDAQPWGWWLTGETADGWPNARWIDPPDSSQPDPDEDL